MSTNFEEGALGSLSMEPDQPVPSTRLLASPPSAAVEVDSTSGAGKPPITSPSLQRIESAGTLSPSRLTASNANLSTADRRQSAKMRSPKKSIFSNSFEVSAAGSTSSHSLAGGGASSRSPRVGSIFLAADDDTGLKGRLANKLNPPERMGSFASSHTGSEGDGESSGGRQSRSVSGMAQSVNGVGKKFSFPMEVDLGEFQSTNGGQRGGSTSARSGGENTKILEYISQEEILHMQQIFASHDRENTGSVNVVELRSLLAAIGHDMPEEQAIDLLHQVDNNNNGLLEFEEFLQMIRIFKEMAQFRLYDKNSSSVADNYLSKQMLKFRMMLTDSWLRAGWEILLSFVCFYIFVSVLALHLHVSDHTHEQFRAAFLPADIIVTFLILIEGLSRMRLATFNQQGKIVDNPREIFQRYASSFLLTDFLALLPMRLFSNDRTTSLVLAHFRLLFVPRIFTFFQPSGRSAMTRQYIYFYFLFVPGLQNVLYFLSLVHLCAVIWFNLFDGGRTYSACVYISMYILAGAGLGDIPPVSDLQRWWANCMCGLAMLVNGMVVGGVVSFLAQGDVEDMRRSRLVEMQAILRFFEVPTPFQEEVLQFQNHLLLKNLKVSFGGLVAQLPIEIQLNLSLQFKLELLREVPFFAEAHETVRIAMTRMLHPVVFRPEEHLALAGETGEAMFFINYGFVDELSDSGVYLTTLASGDNFGANLLLAPPDHPFLHEHSAKSLTYIEVLLLSRTRFFKICDEFPTFKHRVQQLSETYCAAYNASKMGRRRSSMPVLALPGPTIESGGEEDDEATPIYGFTAEAATEDTPSSLDGIQPSSTFFFEATGAIHRTLEEAEGNPHRIGSGDYNPAAIDDNMKALRIARTEDPDELLEMLEADLQQLEELSSAFFQKVLKTTPPPAQGSNYVGIHHRPAHPRTPPSHPVTVTPSDGLHNPNSSHHPHVRALILEDASAASESTPHSTPAIPPHTPTHHTHPGSGQQHHPPSSRGHQGASPQQATSNPAVPVHPAFVSTQSSSSSQSENSEHNTAVAAEEEDLTDHPLQNRLLPDTSHAAPSAQLDFDNRPVNQVPHVVPGAGIVRAGAGGPITTAPITATTPTTTTSSVPGSGRTLVLQSNASLQIASKDEHDDDI
jgi:Ca2+-binding EF-hand superfamily protein